MSRHTDSAAAQTPNSHTATVMSGTGNWTVSSKDTSFSVTNPADTGGPAWHDQPDGVFDATNYASIEVVTMVIDLKSLTSATIKFIGDDTTRYVNPVDSVGYTARTDIEVINDTGLDLNGLVLQLANADPQAKLNLVPGVIEFGSSVNANYAYFYDTQPTSGQQLTLYSPDANVTTPVGAAPSTMSLLGGIPKGGVASVMTTIHNTQLAANNDFSMVVTPV